MAGVSFAGLSFSAVIRMSSSAPAAATAAPAPARVALRFFARTGARLTGSERVWAAVVLLLTALISMWSPRDHIRSRGETVPVAATENRRRITLSTGRRGWERLRLSHADSRRHEDPMA